MALLKLRFLVSCPFLPSIHFSFVFFSFKQHVHDGRKESLDGFVKTFEKLPTTDGYPGIFALDCEMVSPQSAGQHGHRMRLLEEGCVTRKALFLCHLLSFLWTLNHRGVC